MARLAATAVLAMVGRGEAQDVFLAARQLQEASADGKMECPNGWGQVGEQNADIQGCGLEECASRYSVPSLQACSQKCEWSGLGCKSFSWAPRGGDRDHPGEKVCTLYGTSEATQLWGPNQILCTKEVFECPQGWVEPAGANDIHGCGLRGCDSRYSVPSLEACSRACDWQRYCRAFTWAPVGGDRNHPSEKVGGPNADIQGCGLEGCAGRYTVPSIEACSLKCEWSGLGCKAFSWAPVNGDKNHLEEKVCTVYGTDVQNQAWGPNQILCKPWQ